MLDDTRVGAAHNPKLMLIRDGIFRHEGSMVLVRPIDLILARKRLSTIATLLDGEVPHTCERIWEALPPTGDPCHDKWAGQTMLRKRLGHNVEWSNISGSIEDVFRGDRLRLEE